MAESVISFIPRLILFDFGNVLEGPKNPKQFEKLLNSIAEQYGLPDGQAVWDHLYISTDWEQAKRGQITAEQFWESRLQTLGISSRNEQELFVHKIESCREIYPAMRRLIHDLQNRCRLGIVSNSYLPDLDQYLASHCNFPDVFDPVISSAREGIAKPDPAIFERALQQGQCQPNETLFVDDLERNTLAATKLGIRAIVFTSPEALQVQLVEWGILTV
jgi:putative hydrolase of the HAD superfamily